MNVDDQKYYFFPDVKCHQMHQMLKNSDKIPGEISYSEASSFLHISKRSVIDFCVDKSQEYICENNREVCQVYIVSGTNVLSI